MKLREKCWVISVITYEFVSFYVKKIKNSVLLCFIRYL